MRLLRAIVVTILLIPFYRHLEKLDQYVDPAIYRPLHFLGMALVAGVFYLLVPAGKEKEKSQDPSWKSAYTWLVFGAMVLLMVGMWIFELLTGNVVGHIAAVCIYMIPIVILGLVRVAGKKLN